MPKPRRASVWPVAQTTSTPQRKGRYLLESMAHPAKMLPAIARHAVEAYTKPGDLVVDPMCGIGTTLVEAIHLGRHAFGVEYESRWAKLANANVALAQSQGASGNASAASGDGRFVAELAPPEFFGSTSLVITSPPYGPSLHGNIKAGNGGIAKWDTTYSEDKTNLGYASEAGLLDAFGEILAGCYELLKPGGFVVITTRPWRHKGELVDLPGEVAELSASIGFAIAERNVALLCRLTEDDVVGRPSFFQRDYVVKQREKGVPISVIAHEDLLVLRRPQKSSSKQTPTNQK